MIVSQLAPVLADQGQPVAAETETEPVEALAATETDVAESVGAQTVEVVKVFDSSLTLFPPRPIAVTRAW